MASPFVGQLAVFGFNFAPRGWAQCNGQLLAIQQNQALFSILGTTYGGNGTTNFALPNLRGRTPLHFGSGYSLGQIGGAENVTLISTQLPGHTHIMAASSGAPLLAPATGNYYAQSPGSFAASSNGAAGAPSIAGNTQPHNNLSPFLVVNICIALTGIFPSRN